MSTDPLPSIHNDRLDSLEIPFRQRKNQIHYGDQSKTAYGNYAKDTTCGKIIGRFELAIWIISSKLTS